MMRDPVTMKSGVYELGQLAALEIELVLSMPVHRLAFINRLLLLRQIT